jgi:hypothetical protein
VHGLVAENLHGKPYAKLTADSLNGRVEPGFIIEDKKRFDSSYQKEYGHPMTKNSFYTGEENRNVSVKPILQTHV